MEIKNAIITKTFLGNRDGWFSFVLYFESDGVGGGFGTFALDTYDPASNQRVFTPQSMEIISKILDVIGVSSWEELKGQYFRFRYDGMSKPVKRIGNIIKDKWFDVDEFYKKG